MSTVGATLRSPAVAVQRSCGSSIRLGVRPDKVAGDGRAAGLIEEDCPRHVAIDQIVPIGSDNGVVSPAIGTLDFPETATGWGLIGAVVD